MGTKANGRAAEVQLLDLKTCSERLGLALWTLRKWASNRRIPVVKLGSRVMVDARDLEKLVEAHRREARPGLAV